MCKIGNLKEIAVEEILEDLRNPGIMGYTIHLDDEFVFKTSNGIKYELRKDKNGMRKLVIALKNPKNSFNDRMVPYKEVFKLLERFGAEETFINLKNQEPNLVFIAKNADFTF